MKLIEIEGMYFMLEEMISRPCLALEIDSFLDELYKVNVGPFEADTAKNLYPNSMRAKFARVIFKIHFTVPRGRKSQ